MKYLKHDEKKFAPCGCNMKQTIFKKSSTRTEKIRNAKDMVINNVENAGYSLNFSFKTEQIPRTRSSRLILKLHANRLGYLCWRVGVIGFD